MTDDDWKQTGAFILSAMLALVIGWFTKANSAVYFILYLLFHIMGRTKKLR